MHLHRCINRFMNICIPHSSSSCHHSLGLYVVLIVLLFVGLIFIPLHRDYSHTAKIKSIQPSNRFADRQRRQIHIRIMHCSSYSFLCYCRRTQISHKISTTKSQVQWTRRGIYCITCLVCSPINLLTTVIFSLGKCQATNRDIPDKAQHSTNAPRAEVKFQKNISMLVITLQKLILSKISIVFYMSIYPKNVPRFIIILQLHNVNRKQQNRSME